MDSGHLCEAWPFQVGGFGSWMSLHGSCIHQKSGDMKQEDSKLCGYLLLFQQIFFMCRVDSSDFELTVVLGL